MTLVDLLAIEMFNAYNEHGPNAWKTFDGRPVPKWNELNDAVRDKWRAAARVHPLAKLVVPPAAMSVKLRAAVVAAALEDAEGRRILGRELLRIIQPEQHKEPPMRFSRVVWYDDAALINDLDTTMERLKAELGPMLDYALSIEPVQESTAHGWYFATQVAP